MFGSLVDQLNLPYKLYRRDISGIYFIMSVSFESFSVAAEFQFLSHNSLNMAGFTTKIYSTIAECLWLYGHFLLQSLFRLPSPIFLLAYVNSYGE